MQNLYGNPFLFGDIDVSQDYEIICLFIEGARWKRLYSVK